MNNGHKPIGVLAIQGDFALHAKMLERIGAPYKLVKHVAQLAEVSGLIMPGGESTTMLKFFSKEGMGEAIKEFVAPRVNLYSERARARFCLRRRS